MNTFIDIQHLSKRIGDLVLLDDVSFSLGEGQKTGIIARNGTGKSTLLNIIAGREDYEDGQVVFQRGLRIGYLEQTPRFDSNCSVIEAALARYEGDMAASLRSDSGYGLSDSLEDADSLRQRVEQMLTQLQITNFGQPISTLSGGQQKRVALATVLTEQPDLLILDEPTNHLDVQMTEWLEKYLGRQVKSLLMVTHDRYFLNNVCTDILELADQQVYAYHGDYEYYLEKRQERLDAMASTVERARNLYRTELDWMRRMPQARGHKAKYRIDAFADLERTAKTRLEERQTRLDMKSTYIGSQIFEAEYVSKAFENGPIILKDFYYNFSRYEKMGIVGPNGTGKSTFLRLLLGEVPLDEGRFVIGQTVKFGYFSQHDMPFNEQMRVIDAVRQIAETVDLGGGRRLTAMQFLNHFLFPPKRQQDYIYKLSGGERRRLQLCTVLMRNPNFLILDEPTNDLDIATLQVLEEYLQDFRGCVIVVSHDRYFTDKVVDHLLVFHGEGKVEDFPGNYTQYRTYQELQEKPISVTSSTKSAPNDNTSASRVFEGSDRRRRLTFKERQEYESLEHDIEKLESEKVDIENQLSSGILSVDEITTLSKRLPQLAEELDEKSMRWLELSEFV